MCKELRNCTCISKLSRKATLPACEIEFESNSEDLIVERGSESCFEEFEKKMQAMVKVKERCTQRAKTDSVQERYKITIRKEN